MMRSGTKAMIAMVLAWTGMATAQPAAVEQIGAADHSAMTQIAPGAGTVVVEQAAAAQVSDRADSRAAARQLGSRDPTTAVLGQASPKRDARPPQPISNPADGRTSAVERVVGKDRCDPADRRSKLRCAGVIENRADDFARTAPALSPEQRLMIDQQARASLATVQGAARRLAGSGQDTRSIEAQSVASIVLQGNAPAPPRDQPDKDAAAVDESAAIVSAIISPGSASAPPPPAP